MRSDVNGLGEMGLSIHLEHIHVLGLSKHCLKFLHSGFDFVAFLSLLEAEVAHATAYAQYHQENGSVEDYKEHNHFVRYLLILTGNIGKGVAIGGSSPLFIVFSLVVLHFPIFCLKLRLLGYPILPLPAIGHV